MYTDILNNASSSGIIQTPRIRLYLWWRLILSVKIGGISMKLETKKSVSFV